MTQPTLIVQVILTLTLSFCAATLVARSSAAQSGDSRPDELIAQMKSLREEVRELGAAAVRAQVLVGRLQLQEARLNTASWQLAEVRREIAAQQSRKAEPLAALKRAEEGMADGLTGFDLAIAKARAQLASLEQELAPLRTREEELERQLVAERRQWTEFNSKLEQLERALPAAGKEP